MTKFKRIHLIVMDSLGIGEDPDAAQFNDIGADTLGHIAQACGGLNMPNMASLGLFNIRSIPGVKMTEHPLGYYGKMHEISNGKDTMTGHWEMMGLYIDKPFRVFPNGFPPELINRIETKTGRKVIGNKAASGTEIIDELGEEHIRTGALIVYTSADSVLQIAAHEDIIPLKELYEICEFCREITKDTPYMIGRIIARPFVGNLKNFTRTANRHDYALKPFDRTTLNELHDQGFDVIALGKISDIYDGEGITKTIKTKSNMDGMDKFISILDEPFTGISFLNLVDFDAMFGHRRNAKGYRHALEEFDARLPEVFAKMKNNDLLLITADHGNDPTFRGTDHTREYVPLIAYSPCFINGGSELPLCKTFADLGATVAENFSVKAPKYGTSFLKILK